MSYNLGARGGFNQWQMDSKPGIYGNYTVVDSVPQEMLSLVDNYWYQWAVSILFNTLFQ